jgi:hypothetical protein
VTLLAISVDEPDESRKFKRDYGMAFPLLFDRGAAVSRAYVGVNYDDTSIPGIVVIRRDGTIAFRQIATTKDDRLTAAQVLAEVDRTLGTTGVGATEGYAAFDRTQLRIELGGGPAGVSGVAAALVPLNRYVLVGPWFGAEPKLEVDAALALRLPLLADTAAIELIGTAGSTPWRDRNAAVRAGVWLAWTPRWAFHVDGGVAFAGSERAWFATVGLSRLIQIR